MAYLHEDKAKRSCQQKLDAVQGGIQLYFPNTTLVAVQSNFV